MRKRIHDPEEVDRDVRVFLFILCASFFVSWIIMLHGMAR